MAPEIISNLIDDAIATSSNMSDMIDPIAWSTVDDKLYLNLSLNVAGNGAKTFLEILHAPMPTGQRF